MVKAGATRCDTFNSDVGQGASQGAATEDEVAEVGTARCEPLSSSIRHQVSYTGMQALNAAGQHVTSAGRVGTAPPPLVMAGPRPFRFHGHCAARNTTSVVERAHFGFLVRVAHNQMFGLAA